MDASAPRTLFQKIWDAHVIDEVEEGRYLLYIDRHLLTEVTSPQAFEGLREAGQRVRRPDATVAVADHNVPTTDRGSPIADEDSRVQVEQLERNVEEFGLPYLPLTSRAQGIVHIIGPEQGFSLPGMTIVCGDSHTSTHGALGAFAFGIGTSEVQHVLATQTLVQKPARNMRINVTGILKPGITAKDLILHIIATIGASGANGHVIEYSGDTIRTLDIPARMTICNMSVEAGGRTGIIAPDEKTFAYLKGRPFAPRGDAFDEAVERWRDLATDADAAFDREISIDAAAVPPMVTWGTSPQDALAIDDVVPDPSDFADPSRRQQLVAALDYMGLVPGQALESISIDTVFIGSCTNSRIEDLRDAARVIMGRRVAPGVRALVVPGSGLVKRQAEQEGLDKLFIAAGFDWRDAGCSMCLGMNPDRLAPGERCASTSNRNFEGRQGPGGRTHLVSPAMAVCAALTGRLADIRKVAPSSPREENA